jgi:hypothetical protein
MNSIYNIADLLIQFEYKYDDYFKHNIEKYETKGNRFDHSIKTIIKDFIPKPDLEPIMSKNNRFIYQDNFLEYLVVTNENNQVDVLITYDLNYKEIHLYLQKDISNIEEKEYIFTGIMFMDLALSKGYISIHASGLNFNNKGILFSAPSKTGKSTHARFWLQEYKDTFIFNDDKPLIRVTKKDILVYGTPWSGKTTVNDNTCISLHSIVFLAQGQKNDIELLQNKEKLIHLMKNINRPRSKKLWENNLISLNHIINNITMYYAHVTNDINSVSVVANTILGEDDESKK